MGVFQEHLFSSALKLKGGIYFKMKITNTKIYDTVKEVIGEDSIKIIEYLKDKKNISDFKIAEKVDRDIHEVRNILYRLYNHNLVSYYRKKDRQKGWYISYWTFNKKRVKELLHKSTKEKLSKYSVRLREEEANFGNFYLCPNACVRVGFEKAVDLEYRCPECGNILNHQDNTKTIDFIKTKIKELQNGNGFISTNGRRPLNGKSNGKTLRRKVLKARA